MREGNTNMVYSSLGTYLLVTKSERLNIESTRSSNLIGINSICWVVLRPKRLNLAVLDLQYSLDGISRRINFHQMNQCDP